MKTITAEYIRSLKPCYEPSRHIRNEGSNYNYTIIELLQKEFIPAHDRLWVILRPDLVSQTVLKSFIDFCGGGETALEAAKTQLSNAAKDTQDKQHIIKNIEKAQINKLIELIQAENI
jgi:hypothetical protein